MPKKSNRETGARKTAGTATAHRQLRLVPPPTPANMDRVPGDDLVTGAAQDDPWACVLGALGLDPHRPRPDPDAPYDLPQEGLCFPSQLIPGVNATGNEAACWPPPHPDARYDIDTDE